MSIFDGLNLSENIEDSAGHAALPTTVDFMDDNGENVVKGFMLAALAYAGMGGAFGGGAAGGGEAAAGGGGGGMAGGGSGGVFSQYGGNMMGQLKNFMPSMGGEQQQQPMPQFNPFSPPQVAPQEDAYRPMQFANNSFSPWAHNNVNAMAKPTSIVPYREEAEHIFSKGKGLFS